MNSMLRRAIRNCIVRRADLDCAPLHLGHGLRPIKHEKKTAIQASDMPPVK